MEKNYSFYNSDEVKCPECNWGTERLSTKAKNKKEALDKVISGEGFCDKCFIDVDSSVYNRW